MKKSLLFKPVSCTGYLKKHHDGMYIELLKDERGKCTGANLNYIDEAGEYRIAELECDGSGGDKVYYVLKENDFTGIVVGEKIVETKALLYADTDYRPGNNAEYIHCAKHITETVDCYIVYYASGRKRFVPVDMAFLIETKKVLCLESPFENDPFSVLAEAFRQLYDKPFTAYIVSQSETDKKECYGFTTFPSDGGIPEIAIFAEYAISIQVETFAHELAHVAVGVVHEHDKVWEVAFDSLFKNYNRICDEMFGVHADGKEDQ